MDGFEALSAGVHCVAVKIEYSTYFKVWMSMFFLLHIHNLIPSLSDILRLPFVSTRVLEISYYLHIQSISNYIKYILPIIHAL